MMRIQQSYTTSEALRIGNVQMGRDGIQIKGYNYIWNHQVKAFVIVAPKPVILPGKPGLTSRQKKKLEYNDTIWQKEKRYSTYYKLAELVRAKSSVQQPEIIEYFNNRNR